MEKKFESSIKSRTLIPISVLLTKKKYESNKCEKSESKKKIRIFSRLLVRKTLLR